MNTTITTILVSDSRSFDLDDERQYIQDQYKDEQQILRLECIDLIEKKKYEEFLGKYAAIPPLPYVPREDNYYWNRRESIIEFIVSAMVSGKRLI
jgi:hypothetical protein